MIDLKKTTAPLLQLASRISNLVHQNRNEKPILISGSPRGGTTWIAESIAAALGTRRILWEPLQEGNCFKKNYNFSNRPYLDQASVSSNQEEFFRTLISGQQANAHLLRLREQPYNILQLFSNDRLIIKFVRGNGVVAYCSSRFNLPPPLVVIRHPCAVIASQMNMGSWEDHPHLDENLISRYPYLSDLVDTHAPLEERLAMTWAGDVLAAKANGSLLNIVFYEDIVFRGADALAPAFKSWGWQEPPKRLEQILGRPSSTTHTWSTLENMESKVARWKQDLNSESVNRILNICHTMGVKDYGESVWPQTQTDR